MQRLEQENYNTREYYNEALLNHFKELGLDYSDIGIKWELLKIYPGGKLLDIGCGVSPLCLEALNKDDAEVYGIDFADELIEKLKEKYPRVHYSTGDFYYLSFEDNFFDAVILGEVIEHAEEPKKVIDEAFRVLKKGGFLALSTPCNETQKTHEYSQHIWSYQPEDMKALIGDDRILGIKVKGNNIICYAIKW